MIRVLSLIVHGHPWPVIGDPTFLGWLITTGYLATSVFCGIYAWRIDRSSLVEQSRSHRLFWWGLFVVMLIMGINKQLDLQCLFIDIVKRIALSQGWYSQRRIFQMLFAACIAITGLILLVWLGWKLKWLWRQYGLALLGILLLITFVSLRIAPVHYMETYPGWPSVMSLINSILELTGIGLIGVSALTRIIRVKQQAAEISNS
ncbi:MAG: hypothetical protein ACYSTT_12590 [Planctomycetota bacterium]